MSEHDTQQPPQPEGNRQTANLARALAGPEWPPLPQYDRVRALAAANSHLLGCLLVALIESGTLDAVQIEKIFERATRPHKGDDATAIDRLAVAHLSEMRGGLLSRADGDEMDGKNQRSEH